MGGRLAGDGKRRCRPRPRLAGLRPHRCDHLPAHHGHRPMATRALARSAGGSSLRVEVLTAVLLIAVPIAFNLAFFELGRSFDYPNILRKEPEEILRRFAAGGSGLILRWEALLVSALLMLPIAALLAVVLGAPPALGVLSVVVGATSALVQVLGLVRWPFAVPELARRYVAAPDGPEGES